MAGTDQQQRRQYRDAKGFLDPSLLPAHLVCTQAQVRLELPIDLLNGMITNDKFCCTRWSQLQLSWWRRPLRLRQESDPGRLS